MSFRFTCGYQRRPCTSWPSNHAFQARRWDVSGGSAKRRLTAGWSRQGATAGRAKGLGSAGEEKQKMASLGVLAHLAALPGAKVDVSLEIHVEVPEGFDERTVRTVSENCGALKFRSHGFEKG